MWGKMYTHTCMWDCNMVQPLWKAVHRFLKNLGMATPFDPVILLFYVYPKGLNSAYYSDTATSVFITAEYTVAKPWN